MAIHRMATTQIVPTELDTAWAFFSDPRNLPIITPPSLGLRITSDLPGSMYEGMIITYTVRPLLGIPLDWVTEITHVEERRMFVDEQRMGPYRLWHHEHHFREVPGGVEARDVVHYALPFGSLGDLLGGRTVRRNLREIFHFRRQVVTERFGAPPLMNAGPAAGVRGRLQ